MTDDAVPTPPETPETPDAATLKDAHERTGRMLKSAGLPFEADEFDDEDSSSSSSSSEEAK